jgi:hypothetical protein
MNITINNSDARPPVGVVHDGEKRSLKKRVSGFLSAAKKYRDRVNAALFGFKYCYGNDIKSHKLILHREKECPLCDAIENIHIIAKEATDLQHQLMIERDPRLKQICEVDRLEKERLRRAVIHETRAVLNGKKTTGVPLIAIGQVTSKISPENAERKKAFDVVIQELRKIPHMQITAAMNIEVNSLGEATRKISLALDTDWPRHAIHSPRYPKGGIREA